jgi:hypothetical protein
MTLMPTWHDWAMLGMMLIACAAAGFSYMVFRRLERHLTALEALRAREPEAVRPVASQEDGWYPIDTAPRTGEPIEIRNSNGARPWYGLFQWQGDGWQQSQNPQVRIMTGVGDWLTWRPYTGRPEEYEDPTRGAQDTPEYWREYPSTHQGE